MQDDSGLKRVLSVPSVYSLFQNLVRRRNAQVWISENVLKLQGTEKVIDVGCGPGYLLDELPPGVDYYGFDISEEYILAAREQYGDRGTFIVGTARDFLENPDERLKQADVVFCDGLLHHLDDDEVLEVLTLAKQVLNQTGRLLCIEPTMLAYQTGFSKWIMNKDRGGNIRSEEGWKALVSRVFDDFSTSIITGRVRIPYVHIILECRNKTF